MNCNPASFNVARRLEIDFGDPEERCARPCSAIAACSIKKEDDSIPYSNGVGSLYRAESDTTWCACTFFASKRAFSRQDSVESVASLNRHFHVLCGRRAHILPPFRMPLRELRGCEFSDCSDARWSALGNGEFVCKVSSPSPICHSLNVTGFLLF